MGTIESNLARARSAAGRERRFHAILQWDAVQSPAARTSLAELGVRVLGYLPEHAFFASIPRDVGAQDLKRAGVSWVGTVYPTDKLPPRMAASGVGHWALRADGSADLRIKYYEDVLPDHAMRELAKFKTRVLERNEKLNQFTVNMPVDQIAEIAACEWVCWIEEAPPPPIAYNDGSRSDVQADSVQSAPYGLSGDGVVLGIWDSGLVDPAHEDFAGRIVLAETDAEVTLHSTHVAGTMAGSGQHSLAFGGTDRQWRGVAPGSSIVSFTFKEPIPKHDEAINARHVVLSQNSWGVHISHLVGTCNLLGEYSNFAPDYDRIITGLYGKPINVVFAAGNLRSMQPIDDCSAGPYGTIGPPATAKNVITVGAINSDDQSMTIFSSWGPVRDGRLKPELVAPGAEVGNDNGVTSTAPGNSYGVLIGTSMATPVVSGAIALLVEDYRAHYNGQDPFPSTMKGLLVHTAWDLDDDTSWFNKGPDFASGYGLVQIQNAVDQLRNQGFLVGQVGHQATDSYVFPVPDHSSSVKVTLVWDDPAAMENAAVALVNDLDLVVLDPLGRRYYPWTLDPANPSAPAARNKEDHLNVVEQVVADDQPASGNWTVQVVGHNVVMAAQQKYTLLFTPATIPAPPGIMMEKTFFSDDGEAANNNGFIDPGETITEMIVLRNAFGPVASNVTATIRTDVPGIDLFEASSDYPNLASGVAATNLTPFAYRVPKTIACGRSITFTCVSSANGFRFTNSFARVVGQFAVTNVVTRTYSRADAPTPIPDGGSVVSTLEIPNADKVSRLDVSLRIDHQWDGDVEVELVHPDGSSVRLIPPTGNSGANFGMGDCGPPGSRTRFSDDAATPITAGSAPFVGAFRPDQPLAAFNGKLVEGTWGLRVSDRAVQETGTLLCWEMTVAHNVEGYVCSLFNRQPEVSDQSVTLLFGAATNLTLAGSDADHDPLTFKILGQPSHGRLKDFSAIAGTITYAPEAGFRGTDSFTYEVTDGYTNSMTATVSVTVRRAEAGLSLVSSVEPPAVVAGSNLTVTLTVTNLGPDGAGDVVLNSALAGALSFVSATVTQGVLSQEGGVIRAQFGDLSAGSNATLNLQVRADQLGVWTNTAVVTAIEFDPDLTDNTVTNLIQVKREADLSLALTATPNPVLVQESLTYKITLTNLGPHTAKGVRLVEALSGGVANDSRVAKYELGDLPAGSNATVTVVVQPEGPGLLTNNVSVSTEEIDPNPADNVAVAVVRVLPVVDLAVRWVSGGEEAWLGRELTLVWAVSNQGPSEATDVRLEAGLPLAWRFVSVEAAQGGGTNDHGIVRCELGALPAGANALVKVTFVPTSVGLVSNTVTVSATETDIDPANNTASMTVTAQKAADLAVSQSSRPDPVLLGGRLTYELEVRNSGPSEATGVRLADALPGAVNFASVKTSQGSATIDPGLVRCELGALAAGSNATVRIVVETTTLGSLTNVATVSGTETDPALANNAVSAVTQVRLDADLSLSGSVEPALTLVEGELTYSLVVSNGGPNAAKGVEVECVWPAGITVGQMQSSQGTATNAGDSVQIELGTLASGATAAVIMVIIPHQSGTLTNRATVSAQEIDLNPANNITQLVAVAEPVAAVALVQNNTLGAVALGQEALFALTVTNSGPDAATATVLESTLAGGLSFVSATATQGSVSHDGGVIRADLGQLAAGSNATLNVRARAEQLGVWTNSAVVTAAEFDPDLMNNSLADVFQVKPDADLAVSLNAAPDPVLEQELVTYSISLTNRGPHDATGVRLIDVLSSRVDLELVQTSQGSGTNDQGVLKYELGDLPAGSNATVTVVVQPKGSGLLTNNVSVSAQEIDLNPADNLAAVVVRVVPAVDLAVRRESGAEEAWLGRELTVVWTISNQGPSEATDVRLEDELPLVWRFVSLEATQGGGTNDHGIVRCELGALAAGSNAVVSVTAMPVAIGLVTNRVTVSATETDIGPANNTASLVVTVQKAADLSVRQSARPDAVLLGARLTYELEVTNDGPSEATGVRVEDALPGAVNFVSAETSQGGATNDQGVVRCELGGLAAGSNATVRIVVETTALGNLTNLATVSGTEADPEPGNNTARSVTQVKSGADLTLSGTVIPALALLERELTYSLIVSNAGPDEAIGVELESLLPSSVSVVRMQSSQGTVTNAGGTVLVELGTLAGGATAAASVVIVPHQSGTLTNTATVFSLEIDPNPANNSTQMVATVKPVAALALSQNDGLGAVALGQKVTFALTVANVGPAGASAVVLKNTLAAGLSLVSATVSQGTLSQVGGVIRADFGQLAAASNATLNLQVRADQLGVWTNTAVVTAAEYDPDLTDNSLTDVIQIKPDADLSVTLNAAPDPVLEQGLVTYLISLTNRGPHNATDVRLADVLSSPVDVELVQTSQGSGTNDHGVLKYDLGDLPAGSNATVTVVVQPKGSGLLTNNVSVSAQEIDLNPADNAAAVVVRVASAVDLTLRRESGAEEAWLGRELTVVWAVSNQGPSEATDVRLEDELPSAWRFVSVETTQGSGTNDHGIVRCELGALAAGASALVRVAAVPVTVGLVTNTATVSATETDIGPANNSASVAVTVQKAADLAVRQSARPDPALLGGRLTYELEVSNGGPSDATTVRVDDTLPGAVNFVSVETSQGSATNDQGIVRCELGDLAAGSNAIVRIVVEATALGSSTNVATVSGTEADPEPANNTMSAVTQVRSGADLVLSGSVGPALALLERELTYSLIVSNAGPDETKGVELESVLPASISVARMQTSQGMATNADGTVRVELGTLPSGATAAVSVVVVPHQAGAFTTTASVMSDAVDAAPDDNTTTLVATVQPQADFVIQQQASAPVALVNSHLTFTVNVRPVAPYAVPQTMLTDSLPDWADFVSATTSQGTWTNQVRTVICDFGEIAQGETATFALTVVPRVLGATTNLAVVASPSADPASANLTSRLVVLVAETPVLNFERTQNKLLLWWPLDAQDFLLEVTDHLRPPADWTEEKNTRVIEGDRVTVTIKTSIGARYYRLRTP